MPPSRVAAAMAELGYGLEDTGGGCEAYVRLLRRNDYDGPAAVVTEEGDPSVPTRWTGQPISWGAYTSWSVGYPAVIVPFASVAAFATATDHRAALVAWQAPYANASPEPIVRVTDADFVARRMSDLGASMAVFVAAAEAWRGGAVVMYDAGKHGAFVGLFAHQLAQVDLSQEAFWMGPGAWIVPLPGDR